MHLPDHLNRSIVSLYRAQGDLPLSPSFVAYELDISTAEAEESLDDLVRDSILEFDFDQDGEIYYRPGSAYEFEEHAPNPSPQRAPEPSAWGSTGGSSTGGSSTHRGSTDDGVTDGYAGERSREQSRGSHRNDGAQQFDGYAGTAVASRSHAADPSPRASTSTPPSTRSHSRTTYGLREYIPPPSDRRPSRRRSSSRGSADRSYSDRSYSARHAAPQHHRGAPRNDAWAEIGPDGCDGSVQPLEGTAPAPPRNYQQTPAQAPARAPGDSPWNEHRRHAGLHPRDNTALVASSPDSNLPVRSRRRGDPLLASFLSLLFVGSGQLYNGEFAKGVAFFVSFVVLWAFALGWMVHIWAAVDAYQVAQSRQELN